MHTASIISPQPSPSARRNGLYWDGVLIWMASLAFITDAPLFIIPALLAMTATVMVRAVTKLAEPVSDPLDVDSSMPESAPCDMSGLGYGPEHERARKRHPQHILAIAQSFFDGSHHFPHALNRLAASDLLGWPQTASALHIAEREALEHDERFRQVLPYMLVRRPGASPAEDQFLVYQRGKGTGESRLAGKVSIGFGGHIDANDVLFDGGSVLDLSGTVLAAAVRELEEELRVVGAARPVILSQALNYANIFLTHDEGVHRVHLGVVMFLDLASAITLECAEPELVTLGMRTAKEILAMSVAGEWDLEVWTALLLEEFAHAGTA